MKKKIRITDEKVNGFKALAVYIYELSQQMMVGKADISVTRIAWMGLIARDLLNVLGGDIDNGEVSLEQVQHQIINSDNYLRLLVKDILDHFRNSKENFTNREKETVEGIFRSLGYDIEKVNDYLTGKYDI